MRMFDPANAKCTPPHCQAWLRRKVNSDAHKEIARKGAAAAIVLLQV